MHAAAAGCGWSFGVDLGARETATIGGMVGTNAGGLHVVRHGAMRAQVLGVEAVLASGAVVRHLDGLVKDNTGYDLAGLLTGSEGTLGVVTAARLRLVPPVGSAVAALIACDTAADAVGLAAEARRTLAGVVAIEAMWRPALELVERQLGVGCPVALPPGGVAVLVEIDAGATPVEDLAALAGDREAVRRHRVRSPGAALAAPGADHRGRRAGRHPAQARRHAAAGPPGPVQHAGRRRRSAPPTPTCSATSATGTCT